MNIKVNEEQRKPIENARREKLRREKPLVYEKIMKYDEKLARGESTAIIDFCFDYKCNMHCTHCSNSNFARKERTLTIDDLKDFVRQADELGLAQFNISGGEPLCFDNLDEIILALNPEKFHISMSTNGLLLTEERAKHLKSIGLDKMKISLESIDEEVYMKTRQAPGTYQKAKESLFIAQNAGIQTAIQTVISHQNCQTKATEELAKFANDNGFNLDIMVARAIGRWEGKEEVLITPEDNDFLLNLRNKYPVVHRDTFPTYGQNRGCGAEKNVLHLTKYGDILPCVFIHIAIGNIFEESLKDIIDRGMRIKWFGNHCANCLSGENKRFIREHMSKFYGKPLPISYKEAFTDDDFIDGKMR